MPKHKGNTHGIQKHMLTKVDNDVPYKRHNHTDKIILEGFHQATTSETICQTQRKYEWNKKTTP